MESADSIDNEVSSLLVSVVVLKSSITHVLVVAALAASSANVSAVFEPGAETTITGSRTGMQGTGAGRTGGANCSAMLVMTSDDDTARDSS